MSTSPGSTPHVSYVYTRDFTAPEIRTLFTNSPITLVTNPGKDKAIIPISEMWDYKFGTHPYFSDSSASTLVALTVGGVGFQIIFSTTPILSYDLADNQTFGGSPSSLLTNSASAISTVIVTNIAGSDPVGLRSALANAPLVLTVTGGNPTNGQVVTTTINAAGTGYAPGDTVADDSAWGGGDFLVTVNTVDGGGGVLTYTVTNVGTAGWHVTPPADVSSVITFSNVAPQSGSGSGFALNVTSIAQGDGTLRLAVVYTIMNLL